MTIMIQQELVHLKCGDNLIKFYWPYGFDLVLISGHPFEEPKLYSVFEAHELFYQLLDRGAY